jgi:Ca-activated chloride channel family protein
MRQQQNRRPHVLAVLILVSLFSHAAVAAAAEQLILQPDVALPGDIKGAVDLAIVPGFDGARVQVRVDGQTIVNGLRSPWRIPVDFGPLPVEHTIAVVVTGPDHKQIQWQTTINKGHQSLRVKIEPVDAASGVFEAKITAPDEDPVINVSVWDDGKSIASLDHPPYRFTISSEHFAHRTAQVTARTRSGNEAADFWSAAGEVKSEALDVRTVPLFVSVVDRSGTTLENVDQTLFRIVDNGTEGKILRVGKAFNQPISIALLLDASTSMTFEMPKATRAAVTFVDRALKQGDRCSVFSVRTAPRREVQLTSDRDAVRKAVSHLAANGQTALYDSIASAERELRDEKNRRAIVILTDGGDTSSIATFDEIDRVTKESGVPIYVIAYDGGVNENPSQDFNRLQYLAAETGGFLVTASARNLQEKYSDIEKDLRSQYAITYQITDLARHNQWRKVNVVLKSPQLTARTIRGYFAP